MFSLSCLQDEKLLIGKQIFLYFCNLVISAPVAIPTRAGALNEKDEYASVCKRGKRHRNHTKSDVTRINKVFILLRVTMAYSKSWLLKTLSQSESCTCIDYEQLANLRFWKRNERLQIYHYRYLRSILVKERRNKDVIFDVVYKKK